MKQRFFKIFAITILLLFVAPILFWMVTIYSDIYPNSRDLKLWKPTIGELFQNFAGHKRKCENLRWEFTGYVDDSSFTVRQYYIDKWEQEPSPGWTPESGLTRDSFSIFEPADKTIGLFVYKDLYYFPNRNVVPLKYGVSTEIYFCKLDNWQLSQ